MSYTIDLSTEHAGAFRTTFKPYVDAARKGDAGATSKSRSPGPKAPKSDLRDVRDWAGQNGFEGSSHGLIPGNQFEAYAAVR